MSEYIITVEDWFFKHVHERYTHFFGCPIEEIVRCRDCRFFKEEPSDDAGFCMYWVDRVIYHDADGFCAWGEKRDE